MIKFLIEKGIDVNQKGKDGKTAFLAFMNHNKSNLNGNYPKQVFKLLLDNGVETGEELFDISYSKSDFDQQLFDLLFESMKDVTYVSHQKGRTLLTYILETYEIHETSYYALKKILSRDFNMYSKADEETINGKKRTPFRYFIYHAIRSKLEEKKIFELYDLLLKHGANINEIDSWKTTPFTTVVEEIHENNIVFGFSLAKRLIKDGAKVDVKNRYGKFYLDVLLDRLYYIDEGEIEDSWKNLNREQLDGIIGIAEIHDRAVENRNVDSLRGLKFKTKCHVTDIFKVTSTNWKHLALYSEGQTMYNFLVPNGFLFPDYALFESIEVYYYYEVFINGNYSLS